MTEVFAHRGLHVREPENSVAAFLEARACGVEGVELDVRRTRDAALVVHHDAEIVGVGIIGELNCRDLPAGIPTLAEVMAACTGMTVNVEIKNDPRDGSFDETGALAHHVVAALAEGEWLNEVIISSFDLATCEAVRRADPSVPVGWLLDWRHPAEPSLEVVVERGLSAIHPFFQRVSEQLVRDAHGQGINVNVWTVNGAQDMAQMFNWDVDTLITDDPATALETRRALFAAG